MPRGPPPPQLCRGVDVVSRRELRAAGITDPRLQEAYEQCRRLNASHGRTYYLATLLLPPAKRPYVHALYGFARYADELVDDLRSPDPAALATWGATFLRDLDAADAFDVRHPVSRAAIHTARTWDIPRATFEAFLASMAMDATVTGYPTYADLEQYMYGSAAVIGLQMVPILEPVDDRAAAHARVLGEAFQMSNFIRDVAEDLQRGRIYLPQEDLDKFDVTRADLRARPHPVQRARPAAVRDRADPRALRRRGARHRHAAPDQPRLHPHGVHAVRRHPRRRRGGRPAGAGPSGRRAAAPPAGGRRTRTAQGASRAGRLTPRRPQKTHHAKVCTTSEKPNSRSSTGAYTSRVPRIASSS